MRPRAKTWHTRAGAGRRLLLLALVTAPIVAAAGCDGRFEGGGELRARKVALLREVTGLRNTVARLERNEAILPHGDVLVAIEASLIQSVIGIYLPFDADVDKYHLRLRAADVRFDDSQIVNLRGSLYVRDKPSLSAEVNAVGALDRIEIDEKSSTLKATLALDHIGIEKAAGLETVLSPAALDEVARSARLAVAHRMPVIQIPVSVQQTIELPGIKAGPFRLEGASLPLRASVSKVAAGRGRLWIGIHLAPGEFVRTGALAPAAATPGGGR